MKLKFNGHSKLYTKISILMAIFTCTAIYAIFACTLYFFQDQTWVFNTKTITIYIIFTLAYIFVHKALMEKLDGISDSSDGWESALVEVQLPQPTKYRRFG